LKKDIQIQIQIPVYLEIQIHTHILIQIQIQTQIQVHILIPVYLEIQIQIYQFLVFHLSLGQILSPTPAHRLCSRRQEKNGAWVATRTSVNAHRRQSKRVCE
jgi:hypothetical protein